MAKIAEKLRALREKHLPYNEITLRRLASSITAMLAWLLIWALVFKLCMEDELIRNYYNLKDMTLRDRILWDIIPFVYRGTEELKTNQMISTVLNCFVLAPFGVTFSYIFKKKSVLRDLSLCFAFSLFVEAVQAFTPFANPATEDLITNTVGYFIGMCLYKFVLTRLSSKQSVIFFVIAYLACLFVLVYSLITFIGTAPLILKLLARTY